MASRPIANLVRIYKKKYEINRDILKLIRPLRKAIKDTANVYSDEFQNTVMKKGGLPHLIDNLIELNKALYYYKGYMASIGQSILENYNALMEVIEAEQQFLESFLKPTLMQIAERQ